MTHIPPESFPIPPLTPWHFPFPGALGETRPSTGGAWGPKGSRQWRGPVLADDLQTVFTHVAPEWCDEI